MWLCCVYAGGTESRFYMPETIEYADEVTLARAMDGRHTLE